MKPNKDITSLAHRLMNDTWAILPSNHQTLLMTVQKFLENPVLPELPEREPEAPQAPVEDDGLPKVAVVEANGVLVKHPSMVDMLFGATDLDSIRYALQDAMEDPEIDTIVMWFNSPGGVTTGIEELGRYIAKCSQSKRLVAFTDTVCASAAYWLASQCNEVVITPTAEVGSVGVFSMVLNDEEAMRNAGIKLEAFSAGKYKLMGHSFHTLTDEEKAILQKEVDDQHEIFKNSIKSNRPDISEDDMEGLTYSGQIAVDKHYADYTVDTVDELITKIGATMQVNDNKVAPTETTVPTNATLATAASDDKIPGTPGVNETNPDLEDKDRDAKEDGQEFDNEREKYQKAETEDNEEKAEDNPEDYVECICDKCGSKYRVKKSEVEDIEAEDNDTEPTAEDNTEDKEDDKKEDGETQATFAPTLQNWKSAIANLKLNPGTLQMREPDHNLKVWRDAQNQFRNQKD